MKTLLVLLVVLGYVSIASTYQCYVCASPGTDGCGDPFSSNSMMLKADVPPGGACIKTKTESGGSVQIARSVTPIPSLCVGGTDGCKKESQDGVTASICCCTKDLCNGVSTVRQQPFIILFLTITTFAMFIYRQF